MRQTIKEIEVNVAYRWFCGFGLTDPIPHFSTFGKNYMRRFKDTDIFEKIFTRILTEAIMHHFVNTKAVFMDSTHIKANANKRKKIEVEVKNESKKFQKTLEQEINADRKENGKKELDFDDDDEGTHTITQSTTDPESGEFHKGEHEKMFAYSAHTVCDKNEFILGCKVTAGNVHDSTQFSELFNYVNENFEFKYIGLDAGYKTPAIAKEIIDNGKIPLMPYTRPKSKNKKEFEYDKYYDFYRCQAGNLLEYSTTNRNGYREYRSDRKMCAVCPNYEECISKSQHNKMLTRHIWQGYLDKVEEIRHSAEWKEYYPKRKETIERVFGDAKEKHGMRYTQLRGQKKVSMEVLLTFACINLKKLAKWIWKRTGFNGTGSRILRIIQRLYAKMALQRLFA